MHQLLGSSTIRLVARAAAVCACLLAPVRTALGQSGGAAQRLAWMAGCWEQVRGARTIEEQWTLPRAGTLFGMSRTIDGERLVTYEQTRIEERDGKLVFVARPARQPEAMFTQVELADSLIVFANPTHDFPQRVSYRLRADGSLLGGIDGVDAGTRRAIEYPMRRVACPASATPAH